MAAITTRAGKGSPLMNNEIDTNFTGLNAELSTMSRAIAVQMTAAASGSNGIQQLDNENLDMGTNDFTLTWEGSLPDWTPASAVFFAIKTTGLAVAGYYLALTTTGLLALNIRDGVNPQIETVSTVSTGLADGSSAKITAVVTRETASSAGSVVFYVNGVKLGSAVTISAATPLNANGPANLFISGQSTVRAACSLQASRLFNRALTAAEVLDLSINGPALADRGASQAIKYIADFSAGDDGFTGTSLTLTGNEDGIYGRDNVLKGEVASTGINRRFLKTIPFTIVQGRRYRFRLGIAFDADNATVDSWTFADSGNNNVFEGGQIAEADLSKGVWHDRVYERVAIISATSLRLYVANGTGFGISATAGDIAYLSNFDIESIGLTSELIASNAQSDTGQIFDTSGNKNHALLPESGATVVGVPVSQTREVRWTNTWDGTNELQYIGGVNQAILPANAYIESIVGTVSGATPHDIIIGDGSDTNRYVTITTGLAAGTTNFALAARTTDGTNLKLTVDPDTNSDMSIAWVISYSTLE